MKMRGEIMNERYLINDICDVGSSKRIYLSEYQDTGIPFYRGKEIIEKDSNKEISNELFISHERYNEIKEKFGVPEKGDILMTAVGTIGISWYVNETDFYFKDGNLIWFKNFKKDIVNSKYLYYIFKSKLFSEIIKNISIGSTQKAITIEQVKKIELEFPKIEIQNRIVKILDNINNKIRVNNEINNNLYELSDNLYNEWFVKFNFPKFDGKLKESELGMIPEKWNVGYFDDGILTKIIKSGVQNFDGFKRYIATADVTNTDITNYTLVDYDNKPSRANMTPIKSSVWFAKMENSIKNILVDDYMGDILNNYIFSTGFMGMECFKNSVNYIWSIINNRKFIDIKNSLSTGTLMAGISNTTIVNFKYLIPDEETLLQYNLKLREINRKIYNNKKQNEILKQLRDALLPKLMNGEIDLNNIEI